MTAIITDTRMGAKSAITFLDSDGNPDTNTADQIKVIASSSGLGWPGIHVERARCNGFECSEVSVPQHLFCMLTQDAYTWERKDGRSYTWHTSYPGQLWINPANTPFSHRSTAPKEFVQLTLDQSWLDQMVDVVPEHLFGELQSRCNVEDEQLKQLILLLLREAETGGRNGPLFAESLATAVAVHYVRNYTGNLMASAPATAGLSRLQLRLAADFVEAHLTSPITLAEMAQAVGMSKFHFARLFKKSVGISPYHYLIHRRLEKARLLLKDPSASISEIAHRLNFSDQSHLSRWFKQHFGVTPRAYQQLQQ